MAGNDLIRYDLLVQDALKGVVRKVLSDAAKDGLAGEHHFYVTFRTDFPGVRISNRLKEKYPQEMTIVLQHQFWDLTLTEHILEVGLSFSGVAERLIIPFDALVGFFDPSVQFGLKFDTDSEDSEEIPPPSNRPRGAASEPMEVPPIAAAKNSSKKSRAAKVEEERAEDSASEDSPETSGAQVVSLDAFRKKN